MLEIIIFASTMRNAKRIFEGLAEVAKANPENKSKSRIPEIRTPDVRISFRTYNMRNEGLRADITVPYNKEIMKRSTFGREYCTIESVSQWL